MTAKLKKLIVAVTVGAVVLLVFLLSIMIHQLISIGVEKREIRELEEKIAIYKEMIEEGEQTKEARSMRWWIEIEARKLGYIYDVDKVFKGE